ncbi:MAG TPA: methyltransferase [Pseudonocardiaceae bacterium]|mgnify:CR=1 FL=1
MTSIAPDTSTPAGILRLGNAFCDAKALLTAVELDLFTVLRAGAATEEEIRDRLKLHGRGLSDFLNLLVALGLLERAEGGRYRNASGADRYLVRGEQTYIGGFLQRSNRNLYPAWGRLAEALRTGKQQSGSDFEKVTRDPALLRQFVNMMDALTHVLGPQLIEAYDGWKNYTSVLDVGGCRGNIASQIVKAHPHLEGHVFDLPAMEPFFDELVAQYGLTGKVTFHGGSFFEKDLPNADIVILGHVLHDWDPEQRGYLVRKAYQAVNPGGVLLVYDRMLDDEPNHVENLVISLDMLLVTDGGSEYTVTELRGHAEAAGFTSITDQPLGDYDTLVICRKDG